MSTEAATLERRAIVYRDWPTDKKAEAIAAYDANGHNLKQTARLLDIHPETLRYWLKDADRYRNEFQPEKSADLASKLENNAHNLADSIADHDLSIVPLAAKATALGIVIDKMQLLRGLPTSINADVERQELVIILQSALDAGLEGEAIDVTPEPEHNPVTDLPDNGLTRTPE